MSEEGGDHIDAGAKGISTQHSREVQGHALPDTFDTLREFLRLFDSSFQAIIRHCSYL